MSLAENPRHRWLTLATVSITQLLMVLDGTIINIALPRAQAELAFSDASRQWVVTAYALTFGALLLLGGRVADYWGPKRTFQTGLALFGASSLWGGLTQSGAELLLARGLQGGAAALMAPAALAFVTITFPNGSERTKAFAIFGSLAGAGSALGMLLGGILTEFVSWRWCLLVNVPIVLATLVAGHLLLVEHRNHHAASYDLLGGLSATVGLGLLVLGLASAESSLTSPRTIGCAVAGLVLLGLFVLVEKRASAPLLPLRILHDRTRATAFAAQGLIGAAGLGFMVYVALHLQLSMNLQPLMAGVSTLPFTAALMGTVPQSMRMMDKLGPRTQMILGPSISALGVAWMSRVSAGGSYWIEVLPALVIAGIGMGLAVVPLNNLALHGVEPHDAGIASATVTATNQIGGAMGLAVLTAVFVQISRSGAGRMEAATSAVMWGAATMYLACAAASYVLLPMEHRPNRAATA